MLQSDDRDLDTVLEDILQGLTPATRDKPFLDRVTLDQLRDLSFVENVLPRTSFLANYLVPQDLYQAKMNQVWRYPPFMEFSFRLRKTATSGQIKVTAGFGVPRWLCYKELRRFGRSVMTREVSRTIEVQTPDGFTDVQLFGRSFELRDGPSVVRKSVRPQFYQTTETVALEQLDQTTRRFDLHVPSQEIVVKRYDAHTRRVLAASQVGPSIGQVNDQADDPNDPDPSVATIRLVHEGIHVVLELESSPGPIPSEVFLTVRLVNQGHYDRRPPRESEWRPLCLICPYVLVELFGFEIGIGPQQHEDSLRAALSPSTTTRSIESSSIQINGVLTKSTSHASLVIGTTFGVFDLLQETPTPYVKSIDEMVASSSALLECFPEIGRAHV